MFLKHAGRVAALAAVATIFLSASAGAATRADLESDVVEWVGAGENTAYVVVDFDWTEHLAAEFVFGVRFAADAISGIDALDLVAAETSLVYEDEATGFVERIAYDSPEGVTWDRTAVWPEWWVYSTSDDYGTSWTESLVGASDRMLVDGDVDGWQFFPHGWPATAFPNGPRVNERTLFERDVVEWAGEGPNRAYVVLDFNQSSAAELTPNPSAAVTGHEFLFGVRFTSDTLTGLEALELLDVETALDYVDLGGGFITEFSYAWRGRTFVGGGEYPVWWTYWTSDDFGATWTESQIGAADRVMTDGDTDGWQLFEDGWPPTTEPNGPRVRPGQIGRPEDMPAMIRHFYRSIVAREGTADEIAAWRDGYYQYALQFDIDPRFIPQEMARVFFLSAEYAARDRSDEEFLIDCYRTFLTRDPNVEEAAAWLGGEWRRDEALSLFLSSEEFLQLMRETTPNQRGDEERNFATAMYVGLLNRLVDSGGLAHWDNQFNGQTHNSARVRMAKIMALEVLASEEFTAAALSSEEVATRLYRAFLDRFPSEVERAFWGEVLETNAMTLEEVVDVFGDSAEFLERVRAFFGE